MYLANQGDKIMTTQHQQAISICDELATLLEIDAVTAMSAKSAARLGFELNSGHIIAIVMSWDWKEADRFVTAACPVARRVLHISKTDAGIRNEIIKCCFGVWQQRLRAEMMISEMATA